MKIVAIDPIYLEEQHISKLQAIGDLKIFEDSPKTPEELKERIREANIIIVGWSNITKEIINSAEKLKMISIWATTYHYVDLETATERGIVVTNVPGYATEAVAEHVFALLLALVRNLPSADKHVRGADFDWRPFRGIELAGKTIGIIGTGSIGCRVAELGKAFKMQILAFDKYPDLNKAEKFGMRYVGLQTLLKESDIITLHVPLTSETERLIGKKEIRAIKRGAIMINTSQGRVIDEKALISALKLGKLFCAGLDVFEEEPPAKNNPLFKLPNTILSPHCGFHTYEAVKRCTDICINNITKFLEGCPQNVVNPEVLRAG